MALALEPLMAAKAKEKQRQAGGAVVQKSAQAVIKTRDELAKAAGVSHDTVAKAKVIQAKATAGGPPGATWRRRGGNPAGYSAAYFG